MSASGATTREQAKKAARAQHQQAQVDGRIREADKLIGEAIKTLAGTARSMNAGMAQRPLPS